MLYDPTRALPAMPQLNLPTMQGLEDKYEPRQEAAPAAPAQKTGGKTLLSALAALSAVAPQQAAATTMPDLAYEEESPMSAMTFTPTPMADEPKHTGKGSKGKYETAAVALAEKYNLPSKVFLSLIKHESGFNPSAVSPVGAIGLTQLMPATAKELGVNPKDPLQNMEGGARYLRQQLDRFGSLPLALAAYNAGAGNVTKHKGIPPFKETQNYVKNILSDAEKKQSYAMGGSVHQYNPTEIQRYVDSFLQDNLDAG